MDRVEELYTNLTSLVDSDALLDATDDLRSRFADDPYTLDRIDRMEKLVMPLYNGMVARVEKFYADNSMLSQKDYAIKSRGQLDNTEFHLTMQLYHGKVPVYKEMLLRHREDYLNDF